MQESTRTTTTSTVLTTNNAVTSTTAVAAEIRGAEMMGRNWFPDTYKRRPLFETGMDIYAVDSSSQQRAIKIFIAQLTDS
jgi:hypothetical protein